MRSLTTLRAFPTPFDLRDQTPEQIIKEWAKHMPRPGGIRGMSKATELLAQARSSVGVVIGLDEDVPAYYSWAVAELLKAHNGVQVSVYQFDLESDPNNPLQVVLSSVVANTQDVLRMAVVV